MHIFRKKSNNKTIFVGLSGGVDSSVSAYLLKRKGYNIVGAFIKIWQPDVGCSWKEDRRNAMRVAAHLGIPFITIDLSEEYKKGVIDYMIKEYTEGRTPNPDVMCNREIKFKAFLNKVIEMGADAIATGHYARVGQNFNSKNDKFDLLKAHDMAKEQSYFLWTLTQSELSKTLFPIGNLKKTEVRRIARIAGLHTFEKKDSQGLCFIGKLDFKDFLKIYIKEKVGEVYNQNGEVIGHHNGVMFVTLGERGGFTITKKTPHDIPMYVIAKDLENNTLTVSKDPLDTKHNDFEVSIVQTNWINILPKSDRLYSAQVRYHQEYQECKVEVLSCDSARIIFEKPQIVAPGQSVVIYDEEVCMGGGVIK